MSIPLTKESAVVVLCSGEAAVSRASPLPVLGHFLEEEKLEYESV